MDYIMRIIFIAWKWCICLSPWHMIKIRETNIFSPWGASFLSHQTTLVSTDKRTYRCCWCCSKECRRITLSLLHSSLPFREWFSHIFRDHGLLEPWTHLYSHNKDFKRDYKCKSTITGGQIVGGTTCSHKSR